MMRRLMIMMTAFGLMSFVIGQKPANYDDQLKGMYKKTVDLISVDDLSNEIKINPHLVGGKR